MQVGVIAAGVPEDLFMPSVHSQHVFLFVCASGEAVMGKPSGGEIVYAHRVRMRSRHFTENSLSSSRRPQRYSSFDMLGGICTPVVRHDCERAGERTDRAC